MQEIGRDLRYAVRQLLRSPGFLCIAVLTLALGIGLNAAVFSVVNAVLLRPLPVERPDELVRVFSSVPGEFMSHAPMATADYEDLRTAADSFADVLAFSYTPLALERGDSSRLVMGELVTGNYFALLGVEPYLGRLVGSDDAASDFRRTARSSRVAVLSHNAWVRRFGADPGVVGASIRVNGQAFSVIGVAPEAFFGLTRGVSPEIWIPFASLTTASEAEDPAAERTTRWLWMMGRLAPGATLQQARAEAEVLAGRLRQEFPDTHGERTFAVLPANDVRILPGADTTIHTGSLLAMAGVALVLLIAGVNVANLLLARAGGRRREIATRLSLGASPAVIARQLLVESLLLALLGGTAGLAVAAAAGAALGNLRLGLPVDIVLGLTVDVRVFLFTLMVSTASAVAFGMAPALDAARTDLALALRGSAGAAGSGKEWRGRRIPVIAQVALSLVLLIAAGLAVRGLGSARRIDPGFDAPGVIVATFAPRLQGYTREKTEAFFDRLIDEARSLREIESAGLTSHLPLTIEIRFARVKAGDGDAAEDTDVDTALVGPGYFETLRMPVIAGRAVTEHDTADSVPIAVVNEAFAGRFWPGQEAVGRRVRVPGTSRAYEVVGLVGNGKYRSLGEPPRPFLYRALAQDRWLGSAGAGEITTGSETLVARVRGEAAPALAEIRRLARRLDPSIATTRLTTLEDAVSPALVLPRVAAALFGLFGMLGLALAAVGIHGVMAYTVSRRRHEIGVRMALGAERRDILGLVLGEALALAGVGMALGLLGAFAATRTLSALLYGVPATDPLTWIGVSLLLVLVALVAGAVPARRAARVDPTFMLRDV